MNLTYFIIVVALAGVVTAVFRALRKTTELTPAEDAAELAETERRIAEIERDASHPDQSAE
jgi:hypothetical protein